MGALVLPIKMGVKMGELILPIKMGVAAPMELPIKAAGALERTKHASCRTPC